MRTNDEIVKIIEDATKNKGMSISELARQVGMAKSAISRYFNRTREFPINRLDDFTKVLNLDNSYVLGFSDNQDLFTVYNQLTPPRQHNVYSFAEDQLDEQENEFKIKENIAEFPTDSASLYPIEVVSKAAAGIGFSYEAHMETELFYTDRDDLKAYTFATQTFGDSMEPLIKDGDIVLIKQGYDNVDGGIYAVDYDSKSFLKKVYLNDGEFIMKSINEKYEDIIVELPIKEDVYLNIVGKVVDSFTPVER